MISDVLRFLSCPHCAAELSFADAAANGLTCDDGHTFDVARQGYVSLLAGSGGHGTADTAEMVAARDTFLKAGHYAGVAELVAELAAAAAARVPDDTCLVDLGAGTGYYLARALHDVDRPGIALDVSKHACRYAAKAHPGIGAVVADAWSGLPIRGRAASVLLNVFAPRNAREMRRVLHPAGRAVVVVPEPDHLKELIAEYGLLSVDDRKAERLRDQFEGRFEVEDEHPYRSVATLSAAEVAQVIGMGPNAWHERAGKVGHGGEVTLAVRAYVLSRR